MSSGALCLPVSSLQSSVCPSRLEKWVAQTKNARVHTPAIHCVRPSIQPSFHAPPTCTNNATTDKTLGILIPSRLREPSRANSTHIAFFVNGSKVVQNHASVGCSFSSMLALASSSAASFAASFSWESSAPASAEPLTCWFLAAGLLPRSLVPFSVLPLVPLDSASSFSISFLAFSMFWMES